MPPNTNIRCRKLLGIAKVISYLHEVLVLPLYISRDEGSITVVTAQISSWFMIIKFSRAKMLWIAAIVNVKRVFTFMSDTKEYYHRFEMSNEIAVLNNLFIRRDGWIKLEICFRNLKWDITLKCGGSTEKARGISFSGCDTFNNR